MSINKLKNEILELVEQTDNEELLLLVKEELTDYHSKEAFDIIDVLNSDEKEELQHLAEESPELNTTSLDELKAHITQWRSK